MGFLLLLIVKIEHAELGACKAHGRDRDRLENVLAM